MTFKIGDHVQVIDEDLSGVICAVSADMATIETDEGFRLSYKLSEIIAKKHIPRDIFSGKNLKHVISEKETVKKPKSVKVRPKERQQSSMEVDLHIEQITTRYKHLGNYDILNMQLDTARYKLDFAVKKRIQKVVFIHGVGDGVLKSELEFLFKRYENISYYPADFQKYGQGATEVYIKQATSS